MSVPVSRYLARLDEAIAKAGDTVEGDCLRAERALYLARDGDQVAARSVLSALGSRYSARPNIRVTSWTTLLDGVIQYFADLSLDGRDRILRSQALAASAGLRRLEGLSSAWLAHIEFRRLLPESVRANVIRAISRADVGDHDVHARVAMVMAYSLHFAGRIELAQPWYDKAHRIAAKEGDRATVSALLHNSALLRVANLRHARYRQGVDARNGAFALLSAESNRSFDQRLGSVALEFLTPVLYAQVLTLVERYAEARDLFETELSKQAAGGAAKWRPLYLAEKSWCHLMLGETHQALAAAELAANLCDSTLQPDDVAPVHSRIALVFGRSDDHVRQRLHEAKAVDAWEAHEAIQTSFVTQLADIEMEAGT